MRLITVVRECLVFSHFGAGVFCVRDSAYIYIGGWTLLSLYYVSCSLGYCVLVGHVALLLRDEKHFVIKHADSINHDY